MRKKINHKIMKQKIFDLRVKPLKNTNLFLGKHKNDLKLNWNQAKRKYPQMNPMGDSDFDGTRNKFDCKPLNPAQDGIFGRIVGVLTGGRMGQSKEDYRKEKQMNEDLKDADRYIPTEIEKKTEYLTGPGIIEKGFKRLQKPKRGPIAKIVTKTNKKTGKTITTVTYRKPPKTKKASKVEPIRKLGRQLTGQAPSEKVYEGAGRPKKSYKVRINPFTGKPVAMPAEQYYELLRRYKAQQRIVSERTDTAQIARLARRGIPPEQAAEIVDQRQLIRAGVQPVQPQMDEMEEIQTMPIQPIQQQEARVDEIQEEVADMPVGYHRLPDGRVVPNSIHRFPDRRYKIVTDLMTGRKMIQPIPPRERWTM